MNTQKTLLIGLAIALFACISPYQWIFHQETTPLYIAWAGAGLTYMSVFFHELGHTAAAWFYGYFTIPIFDFEHGGGFALMFGKPNPLIFISVWAALGYGAYYFREYKVVAGSFVALAIFGMLTVGSDTWHRGVIDFMGPAAQCLVASFLLYRAIYNLAPRGNLERVLNAAFGFGINFYVLIDSFGLLHSTSRRLSYYNQKGSHGFGDFDKIAGRSLTLEFEHIVYALIILTLICLIVPFALRALNIGHYETYAHNENPKN